MSESSRKADQLQTLPLQLLPHSRMCYTILSNRIHLTVKQDGRQITNLVHGLNKGWNDVVCKLFNVGLVTTWSLSLLHGKLAWSQKLRHCWRKQKDELSNWNPSWYLQNQHAKCTWNLTKAPSVVTHSPHTGRRLQERKRKQQLSVMS